MLFSFGGYDLCAVIWCLYFLCVCVCEREREERERGREGEREGERETLWYLINLVIETSRCGLIVRAI